jgi:hypothetical protein
MYIQRLQYGGRRRYNSSLEHEELKGAQADAAKSILRAIQVIGEDKNIFTDLYLYHRHVSIPAALDSNAAVTETCNIAYFCYVSWRAETLRWSNQPSNSSYHYPS